MTTSSSSAPELKLAQPAPLTGDLARAVFGQVMGLVALTLLFGLGLLLGLALGPVLSSYAEADPAALWQAAGATGVFVAALGAAGYATRRDLSSWYTILDFNRLRRAGQESAVPIAASIFLDVLNVFLFTLELFRGGRD